MRNRAKLGKQKGELRSSVEVAGGVRRTKRGRPYKHGGYSLALKDDLLKENPRVTRYLLNCRAGLVKDVAGSEDALSEQQRIMIDRIISKLAVCRLIELYVERYGAFPRRKVKGKVLVKLELVPCLGVNYLAFSNSIDRALIALGIDKRQGEHVQTIQEIAAEIDAEEAAAQAAKARETAAGGPGVSQGGQTPAGQDEGKDQEGTDPEVSRQRAGKRGPVLDGDRRSPDGAGQDKDEDQGE